MAGYSGAQIVGGVLGAVLANVMFDLPAIEISTKDRVSAATGSVRWWPPPGWCCSSSRWPGPAAGAVGGRGRRLHRVRLLVHQLHLIRQPAVTIGRIFFDTFAGIAPGSASTFIGAQLVGGAVGLGLVLLLYPDTPTMADRVVVPHDTTPTPNPNPTEN